MTATTNTDVQELHSTAEKATRLSDFTDRTTLHGFKYALQPSFPIVRRLIWTVVIVVCAGMLLLQMIDRGLYYNTLPVNVDVRVNYNSSLLFPAVTLCNQNAFKVTLADKFNLYTVLDKMFSAEKLTSHDLLINGLSNTTLDEIFTRTAHRKEDFISQCYWGGKECGPEDFDQIATDHGICYTFNNREEDRHASSVGSDNGLRLTLNVEQYEYMPGPRDTVGVKILFHKRGDVPRVHALGHAVPTGTHAFTALKMVQVTNLPGPYGTCDNRSLEYIDQYTVAGCQMDCLTRIAYNACQCRDIYMLHKQGVPPICTVYQYVTCLKPLLENLAGLPKICNCPVSCEFRSFYSDISYSSTSKYVIKEFINENNIEKLKNARIVAAEVTSRMRNETWQQTNMLYREFIDSLVDIEEGLFVSLSRRVTYLTSVLSDNIDNFIDMCNTKERLYKRQLTIVQKGFIEARDDMEVEIVQGIVIAYNSFIMETEKTILLLADNNRMDPSARLMLSGSLMLNLQDKLQQVSNAYINYTTLKRAYESGSPICNHSFRNCSSESNIAAVPKTLLMEAPVHNEYARLHGNLLFLYLNSLKLQLKSLLKIAQAAYDNSFVDKDSLINLRELYQSNMARFVFSRSVFYYETVDWPIRILKSRLHTFQSMWHRYIIVAQNVKERLQSMQVKLQNIKAEFFNPLSEVKNKMESYMLFRNETRLAISKLLLSERMKASVNYFKRYFHLLRDNEVTLIDWIKLMEKEATLLWKTAIDDIDSTDYYMYVDDFQYLRNLSTVTVDIASNYTYLEHLFRFSSIVSSKELTFLHIFTRLSDDSRAYQESAFIDKDFVSNTFLKMSIFYKQLSYEEVRHQIGYDIFALLCDVGGSMGLLLGASVLSVMEVMEFICIQAYNRIKTIFDVQARYNFRK
ncbi:degenerin-like protein del-10 [Argopecten irradians]|uniref:degenerin-like protein del-10 n=1 Tax=Argopecten irradians TaxID=31199 RepID=UPI0037167CC1